MADQLRYKVCSRTIVEQTLYSSWSSKNDSFYEFHWIYKAKKWPFTSFLATKFHEIAISQNVCYVLQKLIIFLNTKNCEIAQLRVFMDFQVLLQNCKSEMHSPYPYITMVLQLYQVSSKINGYVFFLNIGV